MLEIPKNFIAPKSIIFVCIGTTLFRCHFFVWENGASHWQHQRPWRGHQTGAGLHLRLSIGDRDLPDRHRQDPPPAPPRLLRSLQFFQPPPRLQWNPRQRRWIPRFLQRPLPCHPQTSPLHADQDRKLWELERVCGWCWWWGLSLWESFSWRRFRCLCTGKRQ